MWTRKELKTKAKEFLNKYYWKAFAVALVIALAGGNENIVFNSGGRGSSSEGSGVRFEGREVVINNSDSFLGRVFDTIGIPGIIAISLIVAVMIIILFLSLRVFIGIPLEIGGRKFFLDGTEKEPRVGDLSWVFRSKSYPNIVITMVLRGVYILLWTLLLIIPGIVKHYSYKMVPYILVEDPEIDSSEAIRKSMDMTLGHKMDMFVLDLSFLGWYILGALMFGIGVFLVHPYYEATYAQLYKTLNHESYTPKVNLAKE